jgi:hypothetical protein
MNMPGFSAGFSLYRTKERYRMGGMLQSAEALIRPAQFLAPDCFGSEMDCITNICSQFEGEQRTLCAFACRAVSSTRCSPCTCHCDANCNRTCTRTCHRSHGGTTIFCGPEPCTPVAQFPGGVLEA